ncbi:glutaminyl-peptide cyclotransferase [Sphingomonas gilva]|uniref:Glutaminyl-peptide cyclotransferase n=1 Tax=Sphingomonas gilva TaxID=2305907 RepID=A0A396RTA9_9SPHN|nr:glutaminyl-peptide cyclotransferase [Sphingomonas gilva]
MHRSILLPALLLLAAQSAPPATAPESVPVAGVSVVARYPHDPAAFTQGLSWCDGVLYESTGHVGRSDVRRVDPASGKIIARAPIPADLFGEGSACWKDALYSVTWTTGEAFRWDRASLRRTGRFSYVGEGWGLTSDGASLVLSDGTDRLRFIDPDGFTERRSVAVTLNGRPLTQLNELEFVEGEILANVWMTGFIARIDPASGKVTGLIDLRPLVAEVAMADRDAVANGIAYDPAGKRLFVTGKTWPTLFEIAVGEPIGRAQ